MFCKLFNFKLLTVSLLFAISGNAVAECESSLPLQGTESVKTCNPRSETCVSPIEAAFEYMKKSKDDTSVFTVFLQASPWRLYDKDFRILSVEELAGIIKPGLAKDTKNKKSVSLIASWTSVAPEANGKSLAQKLSSALNNFPVTGMDGFLWIDKNGKLRTTHQAFTVMQSYGVYQIVEGDEVMIPLTVGWAINDEPFFIKNKNAEGIMRAGAGWDIYGLCPDHALQSFEAAAKLAHPIAAYNAATIRLERHQQGDIEAAIALLSQAAKAGDAKSQARLKTLRP